MYDLRSVSLLKNIEEMPILDHSKTIKISVGPCLVNAFYLLSKQKIEHESWQGRNTEAKINNFHLCYLSEYALKSVLGQHRIKYAYRGLAVGPVEIVGVEDFLVWEQKKRKSIGLRSRNAADFFRYEELPYPLDRLRDEPGKISDYIIASSVKVSKIDKTQNRSQNRIPSTLPQASEPVDPGNTYFDACSEPGSKNIFAEAEVLFWGALDKENFLSECSRAKEGYSSANQERFKIVPVAKFKHENLEALLDKLDKIA